MVYRWTKARYVMVIDGSSFRGKHWEWRRCIPFWLITIFLSFYWLYHLARVGTLLLRGRRSSLLEQPTLTSSDLSSHDYLTPVGLNLEPQGGSEEFTWTSLSAEWTCRLLCSQGWLSIACSVFHQIYDGTLPMSCCEIKWQHYNTTRNKKTNIIKMPPKLISIPYIMSNEKLKSKVSIKSRGIGSPKSCFIATVMWKSMEIEISNPFSSVCYFDQS